MWRAVVLFGLPLICAAQESSPEKLIEAGHWKRARVMVERQLREHPDDANAVLLSSQIANAFGDRTSPLPLAEKAVRMAGHVARYHRQLAEVQGVMAQHANLFQQVGLAMRFRKEIDAALALDPRDVQAKRDLLEFYLVAPAIIGGDPKKATALAGQIAAVDSAEGFLAQARIAEFHKDRTQTEALLQRASEVRPPIYQAQIALAEFYLDAPHRNDAAVERAAKNALAVDPGRAAAYAVLARLYVTQSNWGALDSVLSAGEQNVADDLVPFYRAAERLIAEGREAARAERYLRIFIGQEAEGNQPTVADAQRKRGLLGDRNR